MAQELARISAPATHVERAAEYDGIVRLDIRDGRGITDVDVVPGVA